MQRAVTFGPDDSLHGILTLPQTGRPDAPIVLLTNAGIIPRQGPHRLNVRIAQALATEGIPSLRFDLSGNGDSRSIGKEATFRRQAVADLQSSMDWARHSVGASRFLMFGICSGAVNAYDLAIADERVEGVMLYDGYWYRSRWTTHVRNFKRAMAVGWEDRVAAVRRRLSGSPTSNSAAAPAPGADLLANNELGNPPLSDFVRDIQRLVDRGADVRFVYSGSVLEFYSYAGQFKDVFGSYPFFRHVRCDYFPDLDHTFVARNAQKTIVTLVRTWASEHLGKQPRTHSKQ